MVGFERKLRALVRPLQTPQMQCKASKITALTRSLATDLVGAECRITLHTKRPAIEKRLPTEIGQRGIL